MKYLPTVNLWNPAIASAVATGQMKLQAGQWVQCGQGNKSRFAGISSGGTLYVAHHNGSVAAQQQRFADLRKILTNRKAK